MDSLSPQTILDIFQPLFASGKICEFPVTDQIQLYRLAAQSARILKAQQDAQRVLDENLNKILTDAQMQTAADIDEMHKARQ